VFEALFITITNAIFDDAKIVEKIKQGIEVRENVRVELHNNGIDIPANLHDSAIWVSKNEHSFVAKRLQVSILNV
jgi:hydroxylamine reductase